MTTSRRPRIRRAILRGDRLLVSVATLLLARAALDPLAVEVVEADAVGAGDDEVEDRPAEGEAAGLAGEAADHLRPSLHLAEAPLEQVRGAPHAAMLERVAQVHGQGVA